MPKKSWDEKHCETVVEMGKLGKTTAQMAAACGISTSSFFNWCDERHRTYHPEFKEAVELAQTYSEAFWTDQLNKATQGTPASTFTKKMGNGEEVERERQYNANLIMFQMRNRFKKSWADKATTEISGPDGGPIELSDAKETLSRRLDQLAERRGSADLSEESDG